MSTTTKFKTQRAAVQSTETLLVATEGLHYIRLESTGAVGFYSTIPGSGTCMVFRQTQTETTLLGRPSGRFVGSIESRGMACYAVLRSDFLTQPRGERREAKFRGWESAADYLLHNG